MSLCVAALNSTHRIGGYYAGRTVWKFHSHVTVDQEDRQPTLVARGKWRTVECVRVTVLVAVDREVIRINGDDSSARERFWFLWCDQVALERISNVQNGIFRCESIKHRTASFVRFRPSHQHFIHTGRDVLGRLPALILDELLHLLIV